MPDDKAYNLTAYDADTGKQVFYWPNVSAKHLFVANEVIDHDDEQWIVIGVRNDTTEKERRIDVRLVKPPED